MGELKQSPEPGSHRVCHRGDVLKVSLDCVDMPGGKGWLRTNIGRGFVHHREIVQSVEEGTPRLARAWRDVPMTRDGEGRFSLALPLCEVGVFEAKAFFLPKGSSEPVWPSGENAVIKVEPTDSCCANTMYSAFVRQFGPGKSQSSSSTAEDAAIHRLEEQGYTIIPHSGTFRDLIAELDFIIGRLGFRIVQLLPIHPAPTTYARMGRFGSPFAPLSFYEVDPSLAEFDRRTTPLDQFQELADAVHQRQARLFIDIPINHTGWASRLQLHHPEWFVRNEDRSFQSPGAWGVTWEDLSRLDYRNKALWMYMADIFLFWCGHGVDGFRCDAGYMIPVPVWEYIVAKVRQQYPDTIFLLEGLGGKAETTESLLTSAGLNWAYSELFQAYDRAQAEPLLHYASGVSASRGLLVHFAETHDNARLAARSHANARMRTALAALSSQGGGFGITNGLEWFADQKIDVHDATPLNWGSETNQVDHVCRLNAILDTQPAFGPSGELRIVNSGGGNTLALVRSAPQCDPLLVLVNLSDSRPVEIMWPLQEFAVHGGFLYDMVTGRTVQPGTAGENGVCALDPGEVLCLSGTEADVRTIDACSQAKSMMPAGVRDQRLKAKVLDMVLRLQDVEQVAGLDLDMLADLLAEDPAAACKAISGRSPAPVVPWQWPADVKRTILVPPGHAVLFKAQHPFAVCVKRDDTVLVRETSMSVADGSHFALLILCPRRVAGGPLTASLTVYEPDGARHVDASLLCLENWRERRADVTVPSVELDARDAYGLCTNGRGAMTQARGAWAELRSQYDALLAANPHSEFPVDRLVMFTRCRAWLVYRGYSQEVNRFCMRHFTTAADGSLRWVFDIPCGMGRTVPLQARLRMIRDRNRIELTFHRADGETPFARLDDSSAVKIILRPDIEHRGFHEKTKAYLGPQSQFPAAVRSHASGFVFAPSGEQTLHMDLNGGRFVSEPEWQYMVPHPFEADRGLDASGDLFSPGYFTVEIKGGESALLAAEVVDGREVALDPGQPAAPSSKPRQAPAEENTREGLDPVTAVGRAMPHFVVKRGDSLTVIAGYPWFLDWGRDTLICLRGMIAAGMFGESADILRQFARFETRGTLPNMIRGKDSSNRDTSDAPLWFVVACEQMTGTKDGGSLLDTDCGGRTIRDAILSIVKSYRDGTPNGIRMDPESGLIFSPSHFTWMDTNFPAGTPRQGYPIEIQALWYSALNFAARIEAEGPWRGFAEQVQESIASLYAGGADGSLVDCLHAAAGTAAGQATPDDALRPNQLLAITLGAVREPALCDAMLTACQSLLVPGAIRSLADRPVRTALPVTLDGRLLNDPAHPYWGAYSGDEDTRRKPAYHNGTAWTWIFPSYSEALFLTHGESCRETALAILSSSTSLMSSGCLGHVPEILDGDAPHRARGCGAQAWGATELYRVWALLQG